MPKLPSLRALFGLDTKPHEERALRLQILDVLNANDLERTSLDVIYQLKHFSRARVYITLWDLAADGYLDTRTLYDPKVQFDRVLYKINSRGRAEILRK
jgi:DNA-binding PadR family transcriptional regulator